MNATILIVDDEIQITKMIERYLRFQGYHTLCANSGHEAIKILENERVDVMISDIAMPGMSGVDLLHYAGEHHPMTQVIMITGYVTLDNALACMRRKARTCIFKPLEDMTELGNAVRQAVEHLQHWMEKFRQLRGLAQDAVGVAE